MATYIISYANISPAVLTARIESDFNCMCFWSDIDEDYFSVSTIGCADLDMLADLLAEIAGI